MVEEIVGGNMNVKVASSKVSDGNEGNVIRNWRKGDSCYKVTEDLMNFVLLGGK